jgi:alpha-ketoglutarate-dependent 2,4-dichlorophenoxyacetate dioxygenase
VAIGRYAHYGGEPLLEPVAPKLLTRSPPTLEPAAMPLSIRQIGPCFVGEATGVDLTRPLSAADVAAIHAGMDRYAVLVFHDQPFTDEQQLAFTQSLGPIELAIGTGLRRPEEYRLPTTFADVSNLDRDDKPFARDDRRRLFAIGNRLWHSDSSFKVIPAKYSLLHARKIPSRGGNTEFADMRAPTTHSTPQPGKRSRS